LHLSPTYYGPVNDNIPCRRRLPTADRAVRGLARSVASSFELDGYQATTHWAYVDLLPSFGATYATGRVVIDRNRITGGGRRRRDLAKRRRHLEGRDRRRELWWSCTRTTPTTSAASKGLATRTALTIMRP